jgi:hypothetical protein
MGRRSAKTVQCNEAYVCTDCSDCTFLNFIQTFIIIIIIIIIIGSTALGGPWPPLEVSKRYFFYGVGLSTSHPTPNLEDQGIPFCLGHHP